LFRRSKNGFSLLEVLIALMVLMIVLIALLQFLTDVDHVWKSTAEDPYAEAANAFEVVAQNLSTATLETYQDYADNSGNFRTGASTSFLPDHLARRSDLDFVCESGGSSNELFKASGRITNGSAVFFLTPHGYTQTYAHGGMEHLLNALGYFVEFGDDTSPVFFSNNHCWRWRLKQIVQPAESLQIFAPLPSAIAWIQEMVQPGTIAPVLAENIATLIVLPERAANDPGIPLSFDFHYDSQDANQPLTRHQLPPRVRLILVAVDSISAQQLAAKYGSNPPPLIPNGLFHEADRLDTDLASLDSTLTAQKINHRIFQRHILLPSSVWSETFSQ